MKMIRKLFITLFILCQVSIISAQHHIEFTEEEQNWIKNHPVIEFGYEADWPPFEMYADGEYTGIVADYVKLIEKYTGIDMIPSDEVPWSETISRLQSGKIHVVPVIGKTNERKQYMEFTEPYISDPMVIVTRDDFRKIRSLKDLKGNAITLPEGYKRINTIKKDFPGIKIETSRDVKECLLKVSTSQADAFVGSLSVASYYVSKFGFANLKIAAPTQYGDIKIGFGVTKDWVIFRDIVQKIFNSLSVDEHNAIKNKWVAMRYEHGIDSEQIKGYILYGILLLLLISSGFYAWNKTLRSQIAIRKSTEKELRQSLEIINEKNAEKDILLKEIHHRVKNNLQIVYSMLNMQSRQEENEAALKVISEGKTRVMAMALIHKLLYESENLNKVDINNYIGALLGNIKQVYLDKNKDITVAVDVTDVILDLDKAIPLGLILNELLTNSYKHAFTDRVSGEIYINIQKEEERYKFEYKDNGIGLDNEDLNSYTSLGMRLINRLAEQLHTKAELKNGNGMILMFNFE